ncbi:MAG: GNAT family N-acetyltransferase [Rickettsiales bacterium]|nr:GNAT family N-acetyltransferase [Rickettsiales bacterium]
MSGYKVYYQKQTKLRDIFMMALDKMKNAFRQDFIFNTIPLTKLGASPHSGVAKIKNYDEVALSETNYISENKIKEIALANELIKPEEEKVSVFITDDRALLDQYYVLRNDIFRNERGWDSQEWFENDYDRRGGIIVVTNSENIVVGGARMMISLNEELLSGEIFGTEFVYSNLFKEMNLDPSKRYGEIDGLVVATKYRKRNVTEKILEAAIRHSLDFNCSYMVGIAFLSYCRIYRSAYAAIGYGNSHIITDFIWAELQEYNYSKDFPIVNIIRP